MWNLYYAYIIISRSKSIKHTNPLASLAAAHNVFFFSDAVTYT